ncbi:phosphoribosylformylglycinamidine cyclo-ligase [Clostridium cellulovorans]|uniref:Phosphoribosylformylglycinamidine cyclo-ligase n=1 Tax=Clostridium cellulovorans (strain ATCC 35296 / DSM 3052 / OCM 3 / 743B) TaxID=573061 RepID=D9SX00_CLOC7|nr:phosphoribosylformylglycinamidine cyclo-ligase [Clostridium cellulovorans]ADL51361.1 phosphoribosylformylglycinamidine cyclo-ligase [Clostridium cellulovorans 743B]
MSLYKESGVDIEEGYRSVSMIKEHAKRTQIPGVLNSIGSFAGMFELGQYKNPVIVSGTDGVGTKLEIAIRMKKYDTVGIDCVAMCVNDILCHGAKPIFFLDYIGCGKLEAEVAADLVKGVSEGCLQSNCALLGGETAEMPGFYKHGDYDIAGFAVGVVEKDEIIDGSDIENGDILIGIESSGVHSNGYSLVRKLIPDINIDFNGAPIGETLLTPTRIYVKPVLDILQKVKVRGMAHITGGGFIENIPRMFKKNQRAVINKASYKVPAIFKYLMECGVKEEEMYNTYNMGIGYIMCVAKEDAAKVMSLLKEYDLNSYEIGYVEEGEGVCLK